MFGLFYHGVSMRQFWMIFILASACQLSVADNRQADKAAVDHWLKEAMSDHRISTEEYTRLQQGYRALLEQYPQWYAGYDGLATLAMFRDDCEQAIDYATRANRLSQNLPSYFTLTVCNTQLGNYYQAITAANIALELDTSILQNTRFLINAALAYTELGKLEVAKNLLGMALKADPGIKNDKAFLAVGQRLAERTARQ